MPNYLQQSATLTAVLLLSVTGAIAPARSEQISPFNASILAQADASDNSQTEEWQEFTSPQGNFTVSMPGKPTEEITEANAENGITESGSFLLELEGDILGYGVFYKHLPNAPSVASTEQTKEFFDGFRDDFVQNGVLDGTLVEESDVMLGEYAGRQLEVSGSEGYIKLRVYLVEERLYLLLAASETQEKFPPAGDRFFNSFKLLANRTTEN